MTVGYKWQMVIDTIGDFHANRLIERFGGEKVKVSTGKNNAVCKMIGAENATHLMDIYETVNVSIPNGHLSADAMLRIKYARLRIDEGMTIASARRECNRSDRWAYKMEKLIETGKLVAPAAPKKQMDLLDYLG